MPLGASGAVVASLGGGGAARHGAGGVPAGVAASTQRSVTSFASASSVPLGASVPLEASVAVEASLVSSGPLHGVASEIGVHNVRMLQKAHSSPKRGWLRGSPDALRWAAARVGPGFAALHAFYGVQSYLR